MSRTYEGILPRPVLLLTCASAAAASVARGKPATQASDKLASQRSVSAALAPGGAVVTHPRLGVYRRPRIVCSGRRRGRHRVV